MARRAGRADGCRPHVLDALDATLGPIVDIDAAGNPLGVVAITCIHDPGAVSQATLSVTTPVEPAGITVELFGSQGRLALDTAATDATDHGDDMRAAMAAIASEFATGVRSGIPHPLDVQRGLRLQRLVHTVETLLTTLPRLQVDEDHVIKALAPSSI